MAISDPDQLSHLLQERHEHDGFGESKIRFLKIREAEEIRELCERLGAGYFARPLSEAAE